MSKKIQVTISDDLYSWLVSEADTRGIKPATFANFLLGEARKNQINQLNVQTMFEKFRLMADDDFLKMCALGLKKSEDDINKK